MNIEQIRTFLDLVETRNFGRTADRLECNQSTVSFRLRALEGALGARLFTRGHGAAELTAEGAKFERYARNLRLGWNLACQEIGLPPGFSSRLRIGMQTQLTDRLVDVWGLALHRQLQTNAVHIASDYSKAMTDQLVFGNLDLAVLYDPEYRTELRVEYLFDEALRMMATRPCALADIDPDDYVLVEESPYFQARHAEQLPHLQQPALSVETGAMARTCLRSRPGAAYLPLRLADAAIADGELFAVEHAPLLHQPVHVACHGRNRDAPNVVAALDILRGIDCNTPTD